MRIASKINAALFAAFACGTLVSTAILHTTIQPRFDEIERAGALADHKRVIEALDTFTDKLETATHDYAYWDQSYQFIQGENVKEFIASNLEPDFKAVENLGVNALVFAKNDGTIIWGEAFDLETQNSIDYVVKELTAFSLTTPGHLASPPVEEQGLVRTSRGLALVAIAPVLKSDGSGTPAGKVISAKMLDFGAVRTLTGVDFSIDVFPERPEAPADKDAVSVESNAKYVVTSSVAHDLAGKPLAYLKVYSSRDVSTAGAMAIKSAISMMVLAGLAAIGVLWLYLRKAVVSRIESLKWHFSTAGESGTIQAAPIGTGNDEISNLAESFNTMANQVNHLRDAVADGAYMSGLSEWAAGTLHNVRNGLVPVAATTWRIEKLFDSTWLRNVETAVSEIKNPDLQPERRRKLEAFLAGSAARISGFAKEAAGLTNEINSATKSVLEMVAEFESYAHRKTEFEDIELLSLLQTVAQSTIAAQGKNVDLVLPSTPANVRGNGIILRQVISNVIINAIEAMDGQETRCRIAVSIEPPVKSDGFVRIAFADNGEGISADRLTAIFQRGVSTRHTRSGGLGLHWCANALKVLGGTIHAESEGPGYGAQFIIELPSLETTSRKAA